MGGQVIDRDWLGVLTKVGQDTLTTSVPWFEDHERSPRPHLATETASDRRNHH
jgi:hypothetical protein